ncbi:hypothetical protein HYG86_02150 [Alkalicella caledoniensis]|uniref:Uncharacterized protein n=1 Tax=Alkalicella caledoniensis TaxID=2731377 RepID=A0A7G9W4P1_ALKCA|nr:tetratricopeptide repeat protein [Alkalicella caledoniensis]QNO13653.1 hypothetical protein HYG86_02150 [Alkalicella caledoniensis]
MAKKNGHIIPISKGVDFYFAMANKSYLKNDIHKALEYYKRAVNIEPDNSVNHFNVASLLAEMGKYAESNTIYRKIVKTDPDMFDCWFFMGLNYGQLNNFKMVKKCLQKYLELCPEGEHYEQATDIITALKNSEYDWEARDAKEVQKIQDLCTKGIELVEKGEYALAEEVFLEAMNINTKVTAPINNLALTYYYQGEIQEAIKKSKEVLSIDDSNIHALCNLVGFYQEIQDEISLRHTTRKLESINFETLNEDDDIKLAITYGNLGKDSLAYNILLQTTQLDNRNFKATYFLAISLFNKKKLLESKNKWARLEEIEPGNPFSQYYISLIEKIVTKEKEFERLPYQIKVPYNSLLDIIKSISDSDLSNEEIEKYKDDKGLFSSMVWALHKGDTSLKEPLVDLMISLNNGKYIGAVVDFCYDLRQAYSSRNYAYKKLVEGNYSFSVEEFWKGEIFINQQDWTQNQRLVLTKAIEKIEGQYELTQVYSAQILWNDYVKKESPIIKSVDTWSDALVGFVLRETVSDADIEAGFNMSTKGVKEKINKISKVIYNF